ncbi:diaminopimelate epimerase [Helicobacter monodelphidis]|uniref:diaminopimelate epimerase n=1 Tax=Helicobacter sp. 15-1451 TaxID=2004995 RepID=UPI000DCD5227|nr:diaminopimelate epimerase [Helicobacter sp. 15-1451]RAX58331.1 diaminopimelate epimerase [Helicobacter sp. 15-1451]
MVYEKYVASGNDFIIFHTFHTQDRSNLARQLCHRHNGIGADGLIVLLPTPKKHLAYQWEFYNCDGSVATMCGNGSRAAALYAFLNKLAPQQHTFLSLAGEIEMKIYDHSAQHGIVEVCFTPPRIIQEHIYAQNLEWALIDTGVPHLVHIIEDYTNLYQIKKEELAALRHQYNANVNLITQKGQEWVIRTFERGVEDETLACGTGMAASFFVLLHKKQQQGQATIVPASGERLNYRFSDGHIYAKGGVKKIGIITQ